MAKIDTQASRTASFADDEPVEQYFRPAAPSTVRAKAAQDVSQERRRRPVDPVSGGVGSDNEDDGFL
ncbi:MAG: hypothetical protein WA510_32390, partial [Acidobacteriaceae bacterium]